jgi:CheY-like chemotaxis protein
MSNIGGGVLVVEDDPEVNALVCAYVDLSGRRSRSAADGTSALKAVKEARPDLILLDVMLPDMDGFEICRRIQVMGGTKIPIILLTALNQAECMSRSKSCSLQGYLNKPFDPDHLLQMMDKLSPV